MHLCNFVNQNNTTYIHWRVWQSVVVLCFGTAKYLRKTLDYLQKRTIWRHLLNSSVLTKILQSLFRAHVLAGYVVLVLPVFQWELLRGISAIEYRCTAGKLDIRHKNSFNGIVFRLLCFIPLTTCVSSKSSRHKLRSKLSITVPHLRSSYSYIYMTHINSWIHYMNWKNREIKICEIFTSTEFTVRKL